MSNFHNCKKVWNLQKGRGLMREGCSQIGCFCCTPSAFLAISVSSREVCYYIQHSLYCFDGHQWKDFCQWGSHLLGKVLGRIVWTFREAAHTDVELTGSRDALGALEGITVRREDVGERRTIFNIYYDGLQDWPKAWYKVKAASACGTPNNWIIKSLITGYQMWR